MKKKIFLILILFNSFLLTSCSAISEEFESIPDKLWPNIWVTISTIIAFLIMVLIVFVFAYKPVKKLLEKRKDYIEKNIQESRKALDDANMAKNKAQEEIQDAHKQAGEILSKAQQVALDNQNKMMEDTKKMIEERQEQSIEELKKNRENMQKEINEQIINNSFDLSKEILKREVNQDDNDKLVDEFINKLNKENQNND